MLFLMTKDRVRKIASGLSFDKFKYPLDVDMPALVRAYRSGGNIDMEPINIYKHTYITNVTEKCRQGNVFLLFLIKSAVRHFDRRTSIRSTWGKEGSVSANYTFKTIFLIGMPSDPNDVKLNTALKDEILNHNDVLQMTFKDDYYNNTQKTVGGIHWAVHNCGHAQYVMFVDDDFYVATPFLIAYLNTLTAEQKRTLFMGSLHEDAPGRRVGGRWFVSYQDYPFNRYPPFISAGAMVISMHFLKDIQIAIQYTKNFRFDDVFLAIVVFKLRIYPQNNVNIHTGTKRVEPDSQQLSGILASHGYYNDVLLKAAWRTHTHYVDALRKVLHRSTTSRPSTSLPLSHRPLKGDNSTTETPP